MKYDAVYDDKWEDSDIGVFSDLTEDEQEELLEWIRDCIQPRKTPLKTRSSYGIKHIYQEDTGNYVTNAQFKAAMIISGFEPIDRSEINHCYCISKKSLAINSRIRNPEWYGLSPFSPKFNYRRYKEAKHCERA